MRLLDLFRFLQRPSPPRRRRPIPQPWLAEDRFDPVRARFESECG